MQIHGHGLSIALVWRDDVVVLLLGGNADHRSAPLLTRTLDALAPQHFTSVWVDLAGLEQLDAAGANALLEARERISARGHDFVIRSPSREAARLLASLPRDPRALAP
jgi:anti-anti-sigma factor